MYIYIYTDIWSDSHSSCYEVSIISKTLVEGVKGEINRVNNVAAFGSNG